jgi:hypothetical protein
LRNLLECVGGEHALEVLELNGVSGGHNVGVCVYQRLSSAVSRLQPTVDLLNKRLDLALLGLLGLRHAAGDLGWVGLDSGDERVGEGMCLGAVVEG